MDNHASFLSRVTVVMPVAIIAIACVGLLRAGAPMALAAEPQAGDTLPRISGTFLQLSEAHTTWSREQWQRLFVYFKQLSISRVVVQWSLDDGGAYYPESSTASRRGTVIPTLLDVADDTGISVIIGLVHDPSFWQRIARDPSLVEVYLRRIELRTAAMTKALAPLTRAHRSFAGWYITEEIDDVNWVAPAARLVLFGHLRAMTNDLHSAAPTLPVAISGFSNGHVDPETLTKFWRDLVAETGIDTLFFQDGVGAGKLDVDEVGLYLEPLARGLAGRVRELQVIIEVFRQTDGAPINDKPFAAVPASADRVVRQLRVAASFSSAPLVFTVPEYMSPLGGPDAAALFEAFSRKPLAP